MRRSLATVGAAIFVGLSGGGRRSFGTSAALSTTIGKYTAINEHIFCGSRFKSFHTSSVMSTEHASIVPASQKHTATVFFLHGLGDTGDGWSPVFRDMIRSPYIKYICPHAPTRSVTVNMGMHMPAWYDVFGLDRGLKEDEEGIKQSAKAVHEWIDAEIAAGVPSERILLGGFSQGGALSLYSAYTYPKKLAGVIALSAYLALMKEVKPDESVNQATPVFQGHGEADPLVPHSFGLLSHEFIKKFNSDSALWVSYPGMEHSACDKELVDVKNFIEKCIPPI